MPFATLQRGKAMLRIWWRLSSINVRKVALCAQVTGVPFERIDVFSAGRVAIEQDDLCQVWVGDRRHAAIDGRARVP